MVISATNTAELERVSNRVHDLWINVESLAQPTNASTVDVELFADGQLRQSVGILTVHHVETVCAIDAQGIAGYNIGRIRYLPQDRRLDFMMNIPCECEMTVSALNVVLHIGD